MMRDSSDSEEEDEGKRGEFLQREESSGAFEVIEIAPETAVLHICTIHENAILNEKLKPNQALTPEEWKQLLVTNSASHTINNYANIIHSICHGLSPKPKVLLWETLCQQSSILPTLKQSLSYNQKYNKTIKQCLQKLKERVEDIFPAAQLEQCIELTKQLLQNYYAEDPEVGFCKSMEYLAFGVIVALRENQAARVELVGNAEHYFSSIIKRKKLRDMYFPGFPGLFTKIKQLEEEVRDEFPKLYNKINGLGKEWQHLFFKHYLTVFLHKVPYRGLFTKIIELLLFQDALMITHILKRVLGETEKELLGMKNEELEQHLKNTLFERYIARFQEFQLAGCLENLMVKAEEMTK